MHDPRASRIKEDVIAVANSQSLKDKLYADSGFLVHAKTLIENGWQERFNQVEELSSFKPSGDKVKDHFMRVALFNLIKNKTAPAWSSEWKQKLSSEYTTLKCRANNIDDTLTLEPLWALGVVEAFEVAFYLTKYNASPNASLLVQFLPIIKLLLLACVIWMLAKGSPEGRPPICLSATARNLLMPGSRLDQDPRLLEALKTEVEKTALPEASVPHRPDL